MQQKLKQIGHGLHLPYEMASESPHVFRFCILRRSAGVSVHLFPDLSCSNFQPRSLRCFKTRRPHVHREQVSGLSFWLLSLSRKVISKTKTNIDQFNKTKLEYESEGQLLLVLTWQEQKLYGTETLRASAI